MPAYGTLNVPTAVYPGDTYFVFNSEIPAVGESSQQVALSEAPDATPMKFSVEIVFSAAPGNFQIDLQTADTDTNADYVSLASLTQANLNASNVCRAEAVNVVAKFCRLNVVSLTNAVSVTAGITR